MKWLKRLLGIKEKTNIDENTEQLSNLTDSKEAVEPNSLESTDISWTEPNSKVKSRNKSFID